MGVFSRDRAGGFGEAIIIMEKKMNRVKEGLEGNVERVDSKERIPHDGEIAAGGGGRV